MVSIGRTPSSPDGERAGDVNIRVGLPEAGGDKGAHFTHKSSPENAPQKGGV